MPPRFPVSPSLHLQCISGPPELLYVYGSTSTHQQRTSSGPYLHTSMSTHLRLASRACGSRAPCLHVCTPSTRFRSSKLARVQACRAIPAFHASMPPRLHACVALPELHSLIPLRVHIDTPTASL